MTNEYIIVVENVSKAYRMYNKRSDMLKEGLSFTRKKFHTLYYALSDVRFQIKKGNMVGIIGENGAGKSTLLKILTGVITPSEGNVKVGGKVAALLELGAGFNPDYTGRQNVYLNGTMMGFTRSEMSDKIESIIEFADIGDFIDQPVKNYSSGMFARLAFAVAINVEPEILIVDEALSVGDIFFQNKCFRRIEQMKKNGVTILYVSHDLLSVKEMCDEALWLEDGRVKMYGDCIKVCNEYSNDLLKAKGEIYNNSEEEESDGSYDLNEVQEIKLPELQYSNDSILSSEVMIKGCYLSNAKGDIVNQFIQGEMCRLSVIVESRVDINNGIVGFALATIKGLWVVNVNSLINDQKKHIKIARNTSCKIDFIFQMPMLMEDKYVLEVAVCDGVMNNYKTHVWLYNVLQVEVEALQKQYALLNIDTKIELSTVKS